MKTPLILTLAILTLPLAAESKPLFNEPVHLGSGSTSNNGQPVRGSVPRSTSSTTVKKPKTTVIPYDAEQMPDAPLEPTTVTTKQGTVTTDAYAPPPPEPTAAVVPSTPNVPAEPVVADAPATPVAPTEPAVPATPIASEPGTPPATAPSTTTTIVVTDPVPSVPPAQPATATQTPAPQENTTITMPAPTTVAPVEPEPVPTVVVERAAPPPAVQLPAGATQTTEPVKTTADNSGYADKMFDAIKSMLGQKTQPLDDSLIRDEK